MSESKKSARRPPTFKLVFTFCTPKCWKGAAAIDGLYAALQSCSRWDCIGVTTENLAKHLIHTLYLPLSKPVNRRVSLQEVLENQGLSFHVTEKCHLVLTLALAIYQLYGTHALAGRDLEPWRYTHPTPVKPVRPGPQSQNMRIVKNSIIFTLGVALLGISYRQPLHKLRSWTTWLQVNEQLSLITLQQPV